MYKDLQKIKFNNVFLKDQQAQNESGQYEIKEQGSQTNFVQKKKSNNWAEK